MAKTTGALAGSSAIPAIELLTNPERVELKPVYVLVGDEEFLRSAALGAIRDRVLGKDGDELGLTRFDGETVQLADVLDELSMLPFLGSRRLVFVHNADEFISAHREALERYIQKPHRTGVLALAVASWPSNTRLAKMVPQAGVTIDCKSPDSRQIPAWCRHWAKQKYNKRLLGDAASLLVELVPGGLGQLDGELGKLAAYVGERDDIRAQDVDQLVAAGRVDTVWKMLDAAGSGDSATALQLLDSLLGAGEQPLMIFGAISSQLRKLAKAYRLVSGGESPRTALPKVGVPPYFIEKVHAQLRYLGRTRLSKLYAWLSETDLGLKGDSSLAPQQLLERLVIRVASPASP
jgi:DNA polymerase-3 subunit delta